jgi:membrane-associated phospholipid phosphatase
MRRVITAIVLLTSSAAADPAHWYDGSPGRRRLTHIAVVVVGGALYFSSETFLKDDLAPATCRRCTPLELDRTARNAAGWEDTALAANLSNLDGYVLAPVVELGLTMLASSGIKDDRPGRWIDDTAPIVEDAVVSGLVNQIVKFGVERQRPFVHFGDPSRPPDVDDNLSFYSGHTTLTFAIAIAIAIAIATSAGIVAHRRQSRLEPLIWSAGYAFAATTGCLRIAADRHYLTDVATGAVVGTAIGLGVPLLLHPHLGGQVELVPTGREITALGRF